MKNLFRTAKQLMEQQIDFVFVTIIASSGSSPRGAGSRMLILADGTSYGTIGGGNVEYTATKQAQNVLSQKLSYTKGYLLHKNETADLGMICGGDVILYFQYIAFDNQEFHTLCTTILDCWNTEKNSWLILDITDETAWSAGFYGSSRGLSGISVSDLEPLLQPHAVQAIISGHKYYSEPLVRAGTVYVFGGGHVAQQLVPLLSHLDFQCVVFDDREAFSNPNMFPDAMACIVGDFYHISDNISIHPEDYVCIMSRGHQYDYQIQKQMLQTTASYIGVMGSSRKSASIREKLLKDGFSSEQIARFTTPIGLDILAETPAEIAVSIAGQLIMLRASR